MMLDCQREHSGNGDHRAKTHPLGGERGPAENTKIPLSGDVLDMVEGMADGIGRVVGENHGKSTSERRATNEPHARKPDERELRACSLHSAICAHLWRGCPNRAAYLLRRSSEGMGVAARTGG